MGCETVVSYPISFFRTVSLKSLILCARRIHKIKDFRETVRSVAP